MKDRNGKTFRRGDVCVVHVIKDIPEELDEGWDGELCVFVEDDNAAMSLVYTIVGDKMTWEFYNTELEIIGDVR